jgi:hypothetical protein
MVVTCSIFPISTSNGLEIIIYCISFLMSYPIRHICATSTSTYCNSCLKRSQLYSRSGSTVLPTSGGKSKVPLGFSHPAVNATNYAAEPCPMRFGRPARHLWQIVESFRPDSSAESITRWVVERGLAAYTCWLPNSVQANP